MKKICLTLVIAISATAVPVFGNTHAYAAETASNSNIESKVDNTVSLEDFNYIQNNYLKQDSTGLFYLSSSISNEYSIDQINSIESAMSGINELIEKGVLKFELQKSRNGKATTVLNTVNNFDEYQKQMESQLENSKIANFGKVLGSYTYCSSYNFSWWGYTTQVNKLGSKLLRDELKSISGMIGGVSGTIGLGAAMIKIFGPVWGTAITAATAIAGTVTVGVALKNFDFGITSGKGTQVTGVSDPYKGIFFKVEAK